MPIEPNHTPRMDVHSAVRWSAASKYGAQAVRLFVSLVLARLLAPEYFGLLGMATIVTGFASIFQNLGFQSAIIQRKQNSKELLSTLFWVNLALCVLLALTIVAIAPAVAWFYQDPRVAPIVAVLAMQFILDAFAMLPRAMLVRQMAFNSLALREIASILVSGTTSIILVLLGWGVWAIVVGPLAGVTAELVLLNVLSPFRPQLVFDRQGLRECLAFGLNLTGFGIFNYFARNADKFIIGAFLGPIALGYYTLAYKLMVLPRQSITNLAVRVLFPALCRMQDDDERLAKAYLRACGAIAFVTFPMMAGLAIVARPFVELVLGDKWLPAVPLIWILAPVGAFQSIGATVGQLLLARGKSNVMLWFGIGGGSFLVAGIVAGVPWGVIGIATSYGVASALWIPMSFAVAFRGVSGLSLYRLLLSLSPSLTLTGLMVVGVVMNMAVVQSIGAGQTWIFTSSVVVGTLLYGIVAALTRSEAFRDLTRLVPGPLKLLYSSAPPPNSV